MRVLVTGAAGKTGLAVIAELAKRETAVRAFIRRQEQIDVVNSVGAAEVVVGDMQATAVWSEATRNIDGIYHICPNMHPAEITIGQLALEAARKNKVGQFVFHSVLHPQVETMPHHWHKMRVEEMLFTSGLDFTILQPAAYMQNILANWQTITEQGIYHVPYALSSRMSLVDLADVAEAAAVVLTQPDHSGATYELVGPQNLDQRQIANILSEVVGRDVTAVNQSFAAWEQESKKAGLPPYAIKTLLKMFRYYDQHGFWANSNVLGWLLDRSPTSFTQFLLRKMDPEKRS